MYKITAIDNKVVFTYKNQKTVLIQKNSIVIDEKTIPKVFRDLEKRNSILIQHVNRFDNDIQIHKNLNNQNNEVKVTETKKEEKPKVVKEVEVNIVEKEEDVEQVEENDNEEDKTTRRRKTSK